MTDFAVEGVIEALRAQPSRFGEGRALMLISGQRAQGVTTAAMATAKAAGPGAVYAIDLDLRRNALARAFSAEAPLGPRIDGRLNGASFISVTDARGGAIESAYSFHRIARSRLYVGALAPNAVPQGGRVLLSAASDYWDAARAGGACVIVDAPALERSQAGLRVARHMDGVVLVVGAEPGAAPAAMAAKQKLIEAGANLIGLVYAGASAPVMAIEKMMRRAS